MKIGIITALDLEIEKLKNQIIGMTKSETATMKFYEGKISNTDIVAAVAGVGKVNAAACTQTMILKHSPDIIINVGVAGGLAEGLNVGDIVIAESVAEHDMDTTVCGEPLGFISGIELINIPCDENITKLLCISAEKLSGVNVKKGVIASGDQFIHTDAQRARIIDNFHAAAAEMEGASIGHVCYMNGVPFGVLRALSDTADDGAPVSFNTFAEKASHNSIIIIMEFIKITEETRK